MLFLDEWALRDRKFRLSQCDEMSCADKLLNVIYLSEETIMEQVLEKANENVPSHSEDTKSGIKKHYS